MAIAICLLAAVMFGGGSGSVRAAEEAGKKEIDKKRFAMGVGVAFVRFDTNFKFTNKESGLSAYVDAEGTLGLPEEDTNPIIFGRYRFSKKHAIGFSTFRVRRQVSYSADNLNVGDYTLSGEATLTDRTQFYFLNYTYTLMQDDRSQVFASFGLYGLDLNYILDLSGEISYLGEPLDGDSYNAEAGIFAPLPMFGMDIAFALSKRWAIAARVTLVGGSYDNISAQVLDTAIRSRYAFTEHLGLILGIEYFNAKITIDDDLLKTDVGYGYDGAFIGLGLSY